jgi:hypothetical protein
MARERALEAARDFKFYGLLAPGSGVINSKELVTTVDIAASDLVAGSEEVGPGTRPALDIRRVIEKDVQAEVSKAKASPDQLERHIRSAFMNGTVLGHDCKQSCQTPRRMRVSGVN